jgi:anthranilate phosphoribosyltransferase
VALSLGYTRALFVHGLDGLDEISLLGKTRINEIQNGKIISYEISPEDFGLTRCQLEDIATGTPEVNAGVIRDVFSGKNQGPRRHAIILNAAGALLIGNKAGSFTEGIKLAGELIDSGKAQHKLEQLIAFSQDCKAV